MRGCIDRGGEGGLTDKAVVAIAKYCTGLKNLDIAELPKVRQ